MKYRHRGDVWRFAASGFYSTSGSNRPDIDNGYFNLTPATLANVVLRGDDIPGSSGIIPRRYSATRGKRRLASDRRHDFQSRTSRAP
jgi:hypothetical protein